MMPAATVPDIEERDPFAELGARFDAVAGEPGRLDDDAERCWLTLARVAAGGPRHVLRQTAAAPPVSGDFGPGAKH